MSIRNLIHNKRNISFIMYFFIICIVLAFYIYMTKKKIGTDNDCYDFISHYPDAIKSNNENARMLEDKAYILNYKLMSKAVLNAFSTDPLLINKNSIPLHLNGVHFKNGGFMFNYYYNKSNKLLHIFEIRKKLDNFYYTINVSLTKTPKIEILKVNGSNKIIIDSTTYQPDIKEKNSLFIIAYKEYILIFDKKTILFQIKDSDISTDGMFSYDNQISGTIKDKYTVKAASLEKISRDFFKLFYFNEDIESVPNHHFNYLEKNWNLMYLDEYANLPQGKQHYVNRLMIKDRTIPAIYMACNSSIIYTLKTPDDHPVLEFYLSLKPKHITDQKRLFFEITISSNDPNTHKQTFKINLSSITKITSEFCKFKFIPNNVDKHDVKISFSFFTDDKKYLRNENKIILALGSPILFSTGKNNKKNVILISLDTLGARHMGCYGYFRNTTPSIDSFAKKYTFFKNAFANSSWTLPSHISMLSSRYPYETGYFKIDKPFNKIRIAQNVKMLAEILKFHGYATFAVTGGINVSARFGFDKGFDVYIEKRNKWTEKDIAKDIDLAIDMIQQNMNRKFFFFFHTYQIHAPYTKDTFLEESNSNVDYRYKAIAKYDSEILYADQHIGRFLKWLENKGLLENTLLIITSDHGENFDYMEPGDVSGAHGITMYDAELKVPLIMGGPNCLWGGRNISNIVNLIDVVPTILDFLNLPTDENFRGISLLKPYKIEDRKEKVVYSEGVLHCPFEIRSVRSDHYKLIQNIFNEKQPHGKTEFEFYDIKNDPLEKKDIYTSEHKLSIIFKNTMEKINQNIISNMRKTIKTPGTAILEDEDFQKQLQALGYIN